MKRDEKFIYYAPYNRTTPDSGENKISTHVLISNLHFIKCYVRYVSPKTPRPLTAAKTSKGRNASEPKFTVQGYEFTQTS
jgi:hypothetical protein